MCVYQHLSSSRINIYFVKVSPIILNMEKCSILLVIYPGQGHINPSLEFAKRLIKMGAKATISTSLFATPRITRETNSFSEGLTIFPISHGYDNGFAKEEVRDFTTSLTTGGCQAITALLKTKAKEGRPFSHVVYTTHMSWVRRITHELGIPSTLLWIQPAFVFCVYYYYFNGYEEVLAKFSDGSDVIELPGLPLLLSSGDIPSFLVASTPDPYSLFLPTIKEDIDYLKMADNPRILVNTCDSLEPEALKCIEHVKMMGVGPLVPSIFLNYGEDIPSDKRKLDESNYVNQWLNSKADASVVYVAFGSYSVLPIQQIEEIARGLLETQRPFLWVIRWDIGGDKLEDKLSCKDELEKQGVIVPWCSQIDVLSHPSVGCFVTHCGWNSTLESLVFGVRSVLIPLWTDQSTNAKLIEDLWKTGKRAQKNGEGIVESKELRRRIDMVMESEELRSNTKKWKDSVRQATTESGSSAVNLKAFFDEV